MGKRLTPAATAHTVPLVIPRGHDHYWRVIREMDRAGDWSAGEVAAASNGAAENVYDFVSRLRKAGIARPVGGERTPRYRLTRSPAATPRLRRDGSAAPPSAQQQLWTAIRQLGQFVYAELILAASTDELAVKEITARSYIARLHAAGYLAIVVAGGAKKPAVWRLRPGMNTGPKAPQVLRAHVVYDPNRCAVIGEAVAEEVVT